MNGTNYAPRELQELEVPLVSLETCQRAYGWISLPYGPNGSQENFSFVVTDDMLCAGGLDGAGTCVGDSGELKQNYEFEMRFSPCK